MWIVFGSEVKNTSPPSSRFTTLHRISNSVVELNFLLLKYFHGRVSAHDTMPYVRPI